MPQKMLRLTDKQNAKTDGRIKEAPTPTRKRAREDAEESALGVRGSSGRQESPDIVPVKRGGGRGLKTVQESKEYSTTSDRADGSKVEGKTKTKEQKLYAANSNAHVETKTVTEDHKKKSRKDGTVTVTSCTTVRKVSYL